MTALRTVVLWVPFLTTVLWKAARVRPKRTAPAVARLLPVIVMFPPPPARPLRLDRMATVGAVMVLVRWPRPCMASSTAWYLGVWVMGWPSYSTRPQEPHLLKAPPEENVANTP